MPSRYTRHARGARTRRSSSGRRRAKPGRGHPERRLRVRVTAEEDTALIAGQLAALTRQVAELAEQLKTMRDRADRQQERADTQQERIDLAARELIEVSGRLQAAADALRESI